MVKVELIYIDSKQTICSIRLELEPGATVHDALFASNIYSIHPETKDMPVGIFSKQVALEQLLKEGDRIEIYRSLILDPKETRRQKAKKKQ